MSEKWYGESDLDRLARQMRKKMTPVDLARKAEAWSYTQLPESEQDMSEPLSDEELNRYLTDVEIAVSAADHHFPKSDPARPSFLTIVAEVDRLRAQVAAMRPIVEAVAAVPTMNGSALLLIEGEGSLVQQARALLAKESSE